MSHTDIATHNGITLRKLHSPDGMKCFGFLTGEKQPNGDLKKAVAHDWLSSAECALNIYVMVDRVNGWNICKHVSIDRRETFGYVAMKDGAVYQTAGTLGAIREYCGWKPTKLTPPKSAYSQNQPGYKADNVKAAKSK